jgi:hypothetical protein
VQLVEKDYFGLRFMDINKHRVSVCVSGAYGIGPSLPDEHDVSLSYIPTCVGHHI